MNVESFALKLSVVVICIFAVHDLLLNVTSNSTTLDSLRTALNERDAALSLLGRQALQLDDQRSNQDTVEIAKYRDASECDRLRVHRVFCRFSPPWRGVARDPTVFAGDMHGVFTRTRFFIGQVLADVSWRDGDVVRASLPVAQDASTFVHASLLMAIVSCVNKSVVVADLGAGWGRWLALAHHASRRFWGDAVRVELIGVEAEPTHFQFIHDHLLDNGINPKRHRLHQRVLHAGSEFTPSLPFYVGRPSDWYGQCIANDNRKGEKSMQLPAMSIGQLLHNVSAIDWLQIDTGGYHGAYELLQGGKAELDRKVRWLVVRTVDVTEHAAARHVMKDWWLLTDYVQQEQPHATPFGAVLFGNGLLTWLNPRRIGAHQFMH